MRDGPAGQAPSCSAGIATCARRDTALSTFCPEAKDGATAETRRLQIIRLIAKMPTLAAFARPRQPYLGAGQRPDVEIGEREETPLRRG